MCLTCEDADRKVKTCDEKRLPFMTLKQAKHEALSRYQKEKKSHFRFYKDGMIDPSSEDVVITLPLGETVRISFV